MAEETAQHRIADANYFWIFILVIIHFVLDFFSVENYEVVNQIKENRTVLQDIHDSMQPTIKRKRTANEKLVKRLDLIANSINVNGKVDAEQ